MRSGCPVSSRRMYKIGLSLLLCFSAGSLCASKPQSSDSSSDLTNKNVLSEPIPVALLERTEPLSSECELAIRRSLEVAPELLAMASWPLDSSEPAECRKGGVSVLALDLPDFPAARSLDSDTLELGIWRTAVETGGGAIESSTAETTVPQPNPLGKNVVALADTSLDEIRGGFELADSNLKFSFGIERAVFINGQLVASTVLNVKDLQLAAGGGSPQVSITSGMPGTVGVVQNGTGNGFAAQAGANLSGTFIQNTLDNQKIQNVTTINATVNASQILRGISVQSAVQNGIVGSLRR